MLALLRQVVLGGGGAGADPAAGTRLAEDGRAERRARRRRARARAELAGYGEVVVLDGAAPHRLAGGRTHDLADTVFDVAANHANRAGIEVGDGAEIDVLRVRLRPGVAIADRFIRLGNGVRIGEIDVKAAQQTAPHDEQQDGFLQIRGVADVRIDALRFENVDRCVMVRDAARLWIGAFACTRYAKGVKLERCEDVYIGALAARVASPHARPDPGYNGLTIEDCARVHLPRIEVEDAAEHAVYLAGGGGPEAWSADIRFGTVITRRSGQCGFKCKAPVSPSLGVSIDTLTVIDAAWRSPPNRNEDGLRVENARGFHVGGLRVRRERGRFSCYAGLHLDGVADFSLGGGLVEATAGPMVMVEDRRDGNARILISRLDGRDIGGDGYLIRHARGRALRELVVAGGRLEGVAGEAVRIEGGAELASMPNYIRLDGAAAGVAVTDMGPVGPERPPPRPR